MTIVKGKALRQDLAQYDGITLTGSRKDSTGGFISGLRVGDEVDVLMVYGQGENRTNQTIQNAITSIGSKSATLKFTPGTWNINDNVTIPSNLSSRIPAGVVFNIASGKTLTFQGPVFRDSETWTSGSGTLSETWSRSEGGDVNFNGTVAFGGSLVGLRVTNLQALRDAAASILSVGVAFVLGHTAAGDGGHGEFRYVSGASAGTYTDDDGITIVPTGGDGSAAWLRIYEGPINVQWFGIDDDGTDQTSALTTLFGNLADGTRKLVLIPPNVLYSPSIFSSLDEEIVLIDLSTISANNATGETNKEIGIVSNDTAQKDTRYKVASTHHPNIHLNNLGGAGTTSATKRLASLVWACGYYSEGAVNKRGSRNAAMVQFGQETSADYWRFGLRSLAPWLALTGEYELWLEGVSKTTGDYVVNGSNHYKATTTGTTGSSAPVHTSGTASDGGVTWQWVDSTDRSIFHFNEYGQLLVGEGSWANSIEWRVSTVDPNGNFSADFKARGASKNSQLKLTPTNSGSALSLQPYLRASDGVGLAIIKSDASGTLAHFDDDKGLVLREKASTWTTAADGDTTPSVAGASTLRLSNTGATSITALDDGDDGQIVTLVATDGNTTLIHSAALMLTGSVDQALTAYSSVTFEKVPASISDRWIEVARSIK